MPEMHFHIRWPDGVEEACYSPSTIVTEHFQAPADYPLADFVARARTALNTASERVRSKFGMGCAQAMVQIASIEATAARFASIPNATVRVERFER